MSRTGKSTEMEKTVWGWGPEGRKMADDLEWAQGFSGG